VSKPSVGFGEQSAGVVAFALVQEETAQARSTPSAAPRTSCLASATNTRETFMAPDMTSPAVVGAQLPDAVGSPKGLQSEAFDLRARECDPRNGVEPALRQVLPRSLDLGKGYVRSSEEVGERVETLTQGMPSAQPVVQWGEDNAVRRIHGIQARDPGDIQKP
jgi:hypothetical protein